MFLVPKRDIRTDEICKFVETRRRHEAMFTGNTVPSDFFNGESLFWSLDCTCFLKAPWPRPSQSLTTSTICLPKQRHRRLQVLFIRYGKPTMITRQTVSNSLILSCYSWCFLALCNLYIVSWYPTSLTTHSCLGKYSVFSRIRWYINLCFYSFASTVGQFVLAASLRSQVNPENKDEFKEVSPERWVYFQLHKRGWKFLKYFKRAFADFALGSIVLHFFVYNFLG